LIFKTKGMQLKITFYSGSIVLFVLFLLWPQYLISSSPADLEIFLEQASKAAKSIDNDKPHSVKVLSVISEMDKKWLPKKVTRIEKIITRKDSTQNLSIIKAVEIEKGKEKDITEKVREQNQKDRKKNNGSGTFSFDHLFAFTKENRDHFNFVLGSDSTVNGRRVKILKATAKEPNEKYLNGKYLFDAEKYSIIEAILVPSKNPKMVKEMKMYLKFGPSNDGHYVLKSFSVRSYAKLLIKNFRIHINEIYSDYNFF